MNYIKIILITIMVCFSGLYFSGLSKDNKRPIDLRNLIFQFFPCDAEKPVITLNCPKIRKFTDDLVILELDNVKYRWEEKSNLYKNSRELGCYQFLCVKWDWGYEFFYLK